MNAPDTSPRWDWSSWQIDAARRALRTAAREGAPGRGGVDPSRRCTKKGLYMLLYGQLGPRQVLRALDVPGTGDSRMFYFIAASTARLAITVMRCARSSAFACRCQLRPWS